MPDTASSGAQRAAAYFRQAGLAHVLEQLQSKYLELGAVGGQCVLHNSSVEERRNLASFLGKAPSATGEIRLKLREIDAALRQSGFACTLPELLVAFFPDVPLITRPEQREAKLQHQERFRSALEALLASQAADTRSHSWLSTGQHGLAWLYARYKNSSEVEQENQLAVIRTVLTALDQLPGNERPERLALFAQRINGNPHSLDTDTPTGRLFLQALDDLSSPSEVQAQQGRGLELQRYQAVGLLIDGISSSVAVFSLYEARNLQGQADPLIAAAGARVLLLPLRQLTEWQSVVPGTNAIYVLENPQVFEEIVTSLLTQPASTTFPTLVCTAGWPSLAALSLLDRLLESNPENTLYYSGDFDLKGLQIASSLLTRYPARCLPWHLDPPSYMQALQAGGLPAPPRELQQLETLPVIFTPVIASLQEQATWAYQEGITALLLGDIL